VSALAVGQTANAAAARIASRAAYRRIAVWWAASRLFVLVCAAAAQTIRWPDRTWHPGLSSHPLVLLGFWDARWYRIVAAHGYLLVPGRFSDPAFFPLLPVVEHGFALVGIPALIAGAVVANLALLIGLIATYELGKTVLPEGDALRSVCYLAIFPYSFVFSMAYPEGLAIAAVALAALLATRQHWLAASACVAIATLARPQGVFLALPLAAIAWQGWSEMSERTRTQAVAALLAGPAALVSFSLYLWHTVGSPVAWSKAEVAWGRSFSIDGPVRAIHELFVAPAHHNEWIYRDAAFCLLYLGLLGAAAWARVPWPWLLCGAAMVVLPLGTGTFTSDGRFGLLALPVFWGLGALGRNAVVNRFVLTVSPILLAAAVLTLRARFP
jgi:hypothetical protein